MNHVREALLGAFACVALYAFPLPVRWGLRAEHHLDPRASIELELGPHQRLVPASPPPHDLTYRIGSRGYPLVISPLDRSAYALPELLAFVGANRGWLNGQLHRYGVVLFRGFGSAVRSPQDFEELSLRLEPRLESEYLGTSPRKLWPGCKFVHTASEFPAWRVIPAHCEMSFRKEPPTRILFFAMQPPALAEQYRASDDAGGGARRGGETPLVDFRAVAADLSATATGRRFQDRAVRYVRHYYDERAPFYSISHRWDVLKTKSWQAMFSTEDVGVAEAKAEAQGFAATWTVSRAGGAGEYRLLKLVHSLPALRVHAATNDSVWHNHHNVLHAWATSGECAFSAQWLNSWAFVAQHWWFEGLLQLQRFLTRDDDALGQHTTHADGGAIAHEDVVRVRAAVWNNTLAYQHEQGDVAMVDNMRIGHGRQPFRGARRILTTWA
tara:strand:- start:1302 stop:2621 length:1320 start_codon:yes stop_codon:yes gene_type:complete